VSYILNNLSQENLTNVERIVLFGSASRGEAGKESDIDIFIEVKEKNKTFEEEISKTQEKFYKSRECLLFKVKGIDNKINIKLGKLKDWGDLYNSVASDGIIFYGPYEAKELPSNVKHLIIFFWDKVGKNRGAFLNKLYGFNLKNKNYPGLITKLNGKKIGKSSAMFPIQYKKEIFNLLKNYKVNARSIEVFI